MFQNDELKYHLENSFTVESQTAMIAEWNMNVPGNMFKFGNYRYRKNSTLFSTLPTSFDQSDSTYFYTGALNSNVTVKSGLETDGVTPILFSSIKEKEALYYSLEECTKPFRPRSGINKASFFNGKFLSHPNKNMFLRPRYYMPHKDDEFKYWTSYRTESYADVPTTANLANVNNSNLEYGISKNSNTGVYQIDDCVPFIVYKDEVPSNRIVVKVQTNIGNINLGTFKNNASTSFNDPFYGETNKTVPKNFKVQYLDSNNQWIDAYSFSQNAVRDDGITPIFNYDGYLSLEYGLEIPAGYENNFIFVGTVTSSNALPITNIKGYAYLVLANSNTRGTLYIYNGTSYTQYQPKYNWKLGSDEIYEKTQFVTDVTNPSYFYETNTQIKTYREFVWMRGLRIVVETMSLPNVPFELIELSPRLVADFTGKLVDFKITKTLADLTSSALPVGQLLTSTGNVTLFDDDASFNLNNSWNGISGSIISKYMKKNVKFVFYEVIRNVNNNNYYVPLKTLYSEGVPQVDQSQSQISINLRDFFFYFESIKAPEILMTEVSLSEAVALLLDSIGFSNYVFKRLSTESDPIIPNFFVSPEQNVAQVLQQLSIATQSGMFFDEYNNFVVMTKQFLLDNTGERTTDIVLYGSNDPIDTGVIENKTTTPLTNIVSISSQDQKVYNDGIINYTERYIQRSYGTIKQSQMIDAEKSWIYKPVLLWEVSGTQMTKTLNNEQQAQYVLAAMPLNSDLSNVAPTVVGNQLINNTIDFGENVYWTTRFQGYFYSNGEIIRYDAIQYNITGVGNVWITNNLEYQKYFQSLPFNGKIYPTGLVRIYSEPYYETIGEYTKLKNGTVVSHGRGQFKTPIQSHTAGLDPYWSNNSYVQGCQMRSEYLYSTSLSDTVTIESVSSSGTTLTMPDIAGLSIGQKITVVGGNGEITLGTTITAINTIIDPLTLLYSITISAAPTIALTGATVEFTILPITTNGAAGINPSLAQKSSRNSIIKNFFSSSFLTETNVSKLNSTQTGTIQSSALVFNGPAFDIASKPRDFVSYVWKKLDGAYKYFGTRVRIIGNIESAANNLQTPVGSSTYYNVPTSDPTKNISLGGGSGGVCIADPNTNNGYYFEIAALTSTNIDSFLNKDANGNATISLNNILFYKIKKDSTTGEAIPVKLWGGIGNIIVDGGDFAGQYRVANETNPTVYDLAIEYIDINATTRKFFLYINNRLVQTVIDYSPIPITGNTMGVFVRGNTRCMFENVYALSKNYSSNSSFDTQLPISSVFGDDDGSINANESLNKYALSGVIQKTYINGISSVTPPAYSLYYDEFGTIMRECAYFNIKYDKAYPALFAKLSPTYNRLKSYVTSGFYAGSYGAEFLIFNATDSALNLDETTGNYLRIQGVTFTQDSVNKITVDDYYQKRGNLSNPELLSNNIVYNPYRYINEYDKIQTSRNEYGKNQFTLESPYIQNRDTAEELLGWLIEKNLRPRKAIGINIFPIPTLQIGDLVQINYKTDGIDNIAPFNTKFVVYNIEYTKSVEGPNMSVYLSEV